MTLALISILLLLGWSPIGRIIFFALGAILCLGPPNLTPAKFLYIAGLVLLSLRSLIQLSLIDSRYRDKAEQIINIIRLCALLLLLNLTVSVVQGFTLLEILRSDIAILIFLLGVPIYVWSGSKLRFSKLADLVVLLGIFSAISFWYTWSQGHGLNNFGSDRIALSSEWTSFLGLAICLNSKSRNKIRFLFYSISIVTISLLMLLSLTRTNILLVLWIILVSLILNSNRTINLLRVIAVSFTGIVFLKFYLPDFFSNTAFISRIQYSWQKYRIGGLSESGIGADQSVLMRHQQTQVAIQIFENNLFFGCGQLPRQQIFDTFAGSVAKFGIIGLTLFFLIFFFLHKILVRQNQTTRYVFLSLGSALFPASLIYNWPDGRSIWLALGLCLALLFSKDQNLI